MKFLLIASVILFYIAFGTNAKHQKEFSNSNEHSPPVGTVVSFVIIILCLILPTINFVNLLEIKWYYSFLINIVGCFILSGTFASIYIPIFGYKTQPLRDIRAGMVRRNLFLIDSLITLGLAIITLIIGLL